MVASDLWTALIHRQLYAAHGFLIDLRAIGFGHGASEAFDCVVAVRHGDLDL